MSYIRSVTMVRSGEGKSDHEIRKEVWLLTVTSVEFLLCVYV